MGIHVMGLTTAGGLPLFARQKGNSQALPFSLVASLNGVHMFCKSHRVALKSTQSNDFTIAWQDFEDSITVIAAASMTDCDILNELIIAIYNCIVLVVGLDEVKNSKTKNIERFKRDIRVCYPLIDRVLDTVDLLGGRSVTASSGSSTDLLTHVETVLSNDALQLKSCLDAFGECIESLFACVLLGNCIAVATAGWWELTVEERKLLTILIECSSGNCTSTDMPVFLPCKSPNVPFRLVSVSIVNGVRVAALCGPTPNLAVVEQQVAKCWRPATELLKVVQSTAITSGGSLQPPRSLPQNITLQSDVIGLLLVNSSNGKYVVSRHLFANKKEGGEILRTFYYQAASSLLKQQQQDTVGVVTMKGVETYWCSEYHKLHALCVRDNLICILYSSAVPTHTIRFITRQTLNNLLTEKQFCW